METNTIKIASMSDDIITKFGITKEEITILRALAQKQKEYAVSERNKANEAEWYRHRRMEHGRPMIHVEMCTFEHEIVAPRLCCETHTGRAIEKQIYRYILNYELFEDDRVVPEYFPVTWRVWFHLFDIKVEVTHAANSYGNALGHCFNHVITDLKEDMPLLSPSTFGVDREGTQAFFEVAEAIFGDILPVKMEGTCMGAVPTQDLVHLMGMENMFMAMYDTPELLKDLVNRIADEYIRFYRFLEEEKLLLPTVGNQHLGQGTFCYNEVLPSTKDFYVTTDLWGFLDSQETVSIAPDMFGEFFFPCYAKLAKEFGQLSYGCCESVNSIWDDYLSAIPNLRNVSVSPWCDEEFMGERLRGKNIIYHRKPSPNFLGVYEELDEEALIRHIEATVKAANGCQLEFAQRDVYTIHHNPDKVKRYVQIIREVCEGMSASTK